MNWELSFCIVGSIWGFGFICRTLRQYDVQKMANVLLEHDKRLDKLESKCPPKP